MQMWTATTKCCASFAATRQVRAEQEEKLKEAWNSNALLFWSNFNTIQFDFDRMQVQSPDEIRIKIADCFWYVLNRFVVPTWFFVSRMLQNSVGQELNNMRSALKNHSKKLRSKRRSRLVFCLDFGFKSRRQFRFWIWRKKTDFSDFSWGMLFMPPWVHTSAGCVFKRLISNFCKNLMKRWTPLWRLLKLLTWIASVCFDSEHSWQILKLWPAQLLNLPPCVQAMSRPTINFCCSGSANRALGRAGLCNLLHFNLVLLTSWS